MNWAGWNDWGCVPSAIQTSARRVVRSSSGSSDGSVMTRRDRSFPASAPSGCSRPPRKLSADRRQRRSSLFSLPQVCGRRDGCAKDSTSQLPCTRESPPRGCPSSSSGGEGRRAAERGLTVRCRTLGGAKGAEEAQAVSDHKHDRSLVVPSFVGGSALPMRTLAIRTAPAAHEGSSRRGRRQARTSGPGRDGPTVA